MATMIALNEGFAAGFIHGPALIIAGLVACLAAISARSAKTTADVEAARQDASRTMQVLVLAVLSLPLGNLLEGL